MFFFYFFFLFLVYPTENKTFLLKNQYFLILASFKKIHENFYHFSLNLYLRFISLQYTINKIYSKIVTNRFFMVFLFIVTLLTLIIKLYFLVSRLYRLQKIFVFYLNKKQKLRTKIYNFVKVKNLYQIVFILLETSHSIFCYYFLLYFY